MHETAQGGASSSGSLPGRPRRAVRYRLLLVVLLVLRVTTPSDAQTAAALQGRVFDTSGAVVPGATITVRSQVTRFVRSVSTDAEGRYYVTAIPAGTYEVTGAARGFQSEIIRTTFEVGRTLVREFHLRVGKARDGGRRPITARRSRQQHGWPCGDPSGDPDPLNGALHRSQPARSGSVAPSRPGSRRGHPKSGAGIQYQRQS